MTLRHFSVKSTMYFAKSACELTNGPSARSASRALNAGSAKRDVHLCIEDRDDFRRRFGGRAQADPAGGFIAFDVFAERRNVREYFRTLCGRHTECAKLVGLDVPDHRGERR